MTSHHRHAIAFALFWIALSQSLSTAVWGQTAGIAKQSEILKCNRATFRVVIDVGHTVLEPGATSARGVSEYEFNFLLAKRIEQKLTEAGYSKTLLLVTGGPTIAGLIQRVAIANKSAANLFLSIHHDSVPDFFIEYWGYEGDQYRFSDRFQGHSIFISYENGSRNESTIFAKLLGKQLQSRGLKFTPHYTLAIMGGRRRELIDANVGVYRFDQLYVLRATQMPAVLLEAGSIINRDEELLMRTEERRSLIAVSVLDAVTAFCMLQSPRIPTPPSHSIRGLPSQKY
jgi:N-acetylmuramoyl-L-alanine amidase